MKRFKLHHEQFEYKGIIIYLFSIPGGWDSEHKKYRDSFSVASFFEFKGKSYGAFVIIDNEVELKKEGIVDESFGYHKTTIIKMIDELIKK